MDSTNGWAFLTSPLWVEFVLGIFAAQIYLKRSLSRVSVGCVLIVLGVTFYRMPGHRILIAGLPAFLILLFTLRIKWGQYLNSVVRRFLLRIGDASYSIYLIQVFTMPIIGKVFKFVSPNHSPDILVVTSIVVTVVLGLLFHVKVERPLLKGLIIKST